MSSVTNRLLRNVFVGLALASGTVSLAFAQSGVYLGAGIGQSKVKIECDLDITCSKDEKDTAFKFFGGSLLSG